MDDDRTREVYEILADMTYAGDYLRKNVAKGNTRRAAYWSRQIDMLRDELKAARVYNRIKYARRYRGL